MKNKTTRKIAIELRKAQRVLLNNQYPGYPFQESIIIDFNNDRAKLEYEKESTIDKSLNKLFAKLLYQVIGCIDNDKPSWLVDRKIESVNSFTSYDFDSSKLYIDNDFAARFYLAIQSALCEIRDKKLQNVVLWGCIDNECDYIDVKLFQDIESTKKYVNDYFLANE